MEYRFFRLLLLIIHRMKGIKHAETVCKNTADDYVCRTDNDRLFVQACEKVIEYDEEVRLHDGSMIWVRITRHYRRVGALGQGSGYKEVKTEVSWDTGFANVGTKTVEFSKYFRFIDKVDGKWYVLGDKYRCRQENGHEGIYIQGECSNDLGVRRSYPAYFYILNQKGDFLTNHDLLKKLSDPKYVYNILDDRGLPNVSNPPVEFQGKAINWEDKKNFHAVQDKYYGEIFEQPAHQFD